jgi:hypothetical protein
MGLRESKERVRRAVLSTELQESASGFLSRGQLLKLKVRAMRSGIWFKALPRIDRVLVDLTIQVVENVRGICLARGILSVVRKVEELLESKLARVQREFGFSLACMLSMLAQKWGNASARGWIGDLGFARYLAVMKLNG